MFTKRRAKLNKAKMICNCIDIEEKSLLKIKSLRGFYNSYLFSLFNLGKNPIPHE